MSQSKEIQILATSRRKRNSRMYSQTPDRRPLLKQQREGNVSSQQLLDRTPIHFEKSNILELGFESADSEGAQVEERK